MEDRPERFWVSYGRSGQDGHVHNDRCRFYERGHGQLQSREEILDVQPDCRVCKGRGHG